MKLDDRSSRIVAHRFRHALSMVTDLIPHTDSPAIPEAVQIACLENWFTNYRMLIEFLLFRGASNRVGASDLVPDWEPVKTLEGVKMQADYGFASEHLSHIGYPKLAEPAQNVTPAVLRIKATALLDVVDDFVHELEQADHAQAEWIRLAADRARASLSGTTSQT